MQKPSSKSSVVSSSRSSVAKPGWIESNISKLECIKFVKQNEEYCKCGRTIEQHTSSAMINDSDTDWNIEQYTARFPTDAFGTLEFQGGAHPLKAKYVRIHYGTSVEDLIQLLLQEWKMKVPNLIISIIGGLVNFEMPPKLKHLFEVGLVRAAKTTGAWILTSGLDTGVTKHVGEALKNEVHSKGTNIVALGIAPWGVVQNKRQLIGKGHVCPYYTAHTKVTRDSYLNSHHNYFLLADNGTAGKHGAEKVLRRNLERYLANQSLRLKNQYSRFGNKKVAVATPPTHNKVPVVAVLIEGGIQAFRVVFELITDENPVPVVVCDGSGRAADLLAFMHRNANKDGELSSELKIEFFKFIEQMLQLEPKDIELLYKEMKLCLKRRELITIYRVSDDTPDIDVAILTALLQESGAKSHQLTLSIAWNRPDLARSQIFNVDLDWKPQVLDTAMTDALISDRLEFVKLLMEKGVNIHNYLSVGSLAILYNTLYTSGDRIFNMMARKVVSIKNDPLTLLNIGTLIELLIGNGYQHHYCHKNPYLLIESKPANPVKATGHMDTLSSNDNIKGIATPSNKLDTQLRFRYPFTELLQWALLTKRLNLALHMILSGEESIAKSLFAVKILKGMKKMVDVDEDSEYIHELKEWEVKFEKLAVHLQNHCYKHDPDETKRLLCYELCQFSDHTCISLAYMCQSKPFLSHTCTQTLLNDLWFGGLREGKCVGIKVVILLFLFVTIIPGIPLCLFCLRYSRFIEFKTKEELASQAQTLEEYLNEMDDSSSSDYGNSTDDEYDENHPDFVKIDMNELIVPSQIPNEKKSDYPDNHNNADNLDNHVVETDRYTSTKMIKMKKAHKKTEIDSTTQVKSDVTVVNLNTAAMSKELHPPVNSNMLRKQSQASFGSKYNIGTPLQHGFVMNDLLMSGNDMNFGLFSDKKIFSVGPFTPLSWKKKIHEFFYAPITKFYMDIMAYVFFLVLYVHVCVLRMYENDINWMETYVYLYIFTYFVGNLMLIANVRGVNFIQKVQLHFSSSWNLFGISLSVFSILGMILRLYCLFLTSMIVNTGISMNTTVSSNSTTIYQCSIFMYGRNILVFCAGGWVLKILQLMQNWRVFGAYIEMIRSLANIITPPILILGIMVTSFGIIRQGIMFRGFEKFHFTEILKNVYLKPYFMLYGEVYASDIDPKDFPVESVNNPLNWLVPLSMVVFMIIANVFILSLVIAAITDVFAKVQESSVKLYMYLRYPMIVEYEGRPFLPPPFIVLLWIWQIINLIFCRCCCCKKTQVTKVSIPVTNTTDVNGTIPTENNVVHSAGLKLFLSTNEIEKVHDFEEECVDDFSRIIKTDSNNAMMNNINSLYNVSYKNCVPEKHDDYIQYQLKEMNSKINMLRMNSHLISQTTLELLKYTKINCGDNNAFDPRIIPNSNIPMPQSNIFNGPSSFNTALMQKLSNMQFMSNTVYDDLILNNRWKSMEETPPISPTTSIINLANSSKNKKNSGMLAPSHRRYRQNKQRGKKNTNQSLSQSHKDLSSNLSENIKSDENKIDNEQVGHILESVNLNKPSVFVHEIDESADTQLIHPFRPQINQDRLRKEVSIEENMLRAEQMEREEMTSVIVQRLRQLSYRNDESSAEDVLDVVREIEASKPLDKVAEFELFPMHPPVPSNSAHISDEFDLLNHPDTFLRPPPNNRGMQQSLSMPPTLPHNDLPPTSSSVMDWEINYDGDDEHQRVGLIVDVAPRPNPKKSTNNSKFQVEPF